MEQIRFIDANYPGVVYMGTVRHMAYYDHQGACTHIVDTDPEGWEIRDLTTPQYDFMLEE